MAEYGSTWMEIESNPDWEIRWYSPSEDIVREGEVQVRRVNQTVAALSLPFRDLEFLTALLMKNARDTESAVKGTPQ